jgi:cupin fold WbuC family metalloprotein
MRSTTFFLGGDIVEICKEQIITLKDSARNDPLKRARFCLHRTHADTIQEMIIAFYHGSYVRPHRHKDKSESFHVLEGELDVVFFDDHGNITKKIRMGEAQSGKTFIYRLNSQLWHTVVIRSECVVLHEVSSGPFLQEENNFALWSPHYGDKEAVNRFLDSV